MLEARPASKSRGMDLIDCIELPVVVVDRDLAVVGFNAAAATLLSLTHSDYGRHMHSIQMFSGARTLEEICQHVIASGSSHRMELADGAGSWFSVNLGCRKTDQNIDGAVLTLTNVTAFRESLERAIEEREYTKAVINTIADALVIVDADLRVQSANQAFYALFQTSRENSQGARFYQLGNGNWDVAELRKLLDGCSPSNDKSESLECDHEFSGVGCRSLLLNARRLIRGSHAGLTALITIQDITERKATEEKLRTTEKLAATGRLAATISHEINNPLEAMTNLVYLARHEPSLPPKIWHLLESVDFELRRVGHITRQTLGFYRDTTVATRIDIPQLIQDVIGIYRAKLTNKRIEVVTRFGPECEMHGFQGEIRQVVSNLLGNAIDASEGGGRLILKAKTSPNWKAGKGPGLRISIGDFGVGIPLAAQTRIFEPFYSTKQDRGTGLGLWLSKSLVEKHGGTIRFRSSTAPEHRGTVFSIFFPCKQQIAEAVVRS